VAVDPSSDSLPENLLRWYLTFSAPMFPGRALEFVRLLDENGREVSGAFLDLSEELWDPSARRLTLLFDPGRVKQGIRTNLETGRPLRAGRRYQLRVDRGWPDAAGVPLEKGVEKLFVATDADRSGPNPAAWEIIPPPAGGQAALVINLGDPVDHALGERLVAVQDERGRPVEGEATLAEGDRRWRFVPAKAWAPGRYAILVSPELEDVAGNRPGRPFDLDLATGGSQPASPEPLVRWFVIPARNGGS
jgi:hypothetical protein